MDAGLPILVFAPIDESGRGPAQPVGMPPVRILTERPVLLALDVDPALGDWEFYRVVSMRFAGLTAAGFAMITPSIVAIPLWSRGADAIQMMQRLSDLGYAGPVEVHCPRLPDARMVMAELSQVSADLQPRLVQHPAPS